MQQVPAQRVDALAWRAGVRHAVLFICVCVCVCCWPAAHTWAHPQWWPEQQLGQRVCFWLSAHTPPLPIVHLASVAAKPLLAMHPVQCACSCLAVSDRSCLSLGCCCTASVQCQLLLPLSAFLPAAHRLSRCRVCMPPSSIDFLHLSAPCARRITRCSFAC
jgi:hypothetical protein